MPTPNVAGGMFGQGPAGEFFEHFLGGVKNGPGHFSSNRAQGQQRAQQQTLVDALDSLTKAVINLTSGLTAGVGRDPKTGRFTKFGGSSSGQGGNGGMQSNNPIGGNPSSHPMYQSRLGMTRWGKVGAVAGVAYGAIAGYAKSGESDLYTMDYATSQLSRYAGGGYQGGLIRNTMYKGFNGGLNSADYATGTQGAITGSGYAPGTAGFKQYQSQINTMQRWNPMVGLAGNAAASNSLYSNGGSMQLRMLGVNPFVGGSLQNGRQSIQQIAQGIMTKAWGGRTPTSANLTASLENGGVVRSWLNRSGFDANTQQSLIAAMQNDLNGGTQTKTLVGTKQKQQNRLLNFQASTADGEIRAREDVMNAFSSSLDAFTKTIHSLGIGGALGFGKGLIGQTSGLVGGLAGAFGLSKLFGGGGGGGMGGAGLLGLGGMVAKFGGGAMGLMGKIPGMGSLAEALGKGAGGVTSAGSSLAKVLGKGTEIGLLAPIIAKMFGGAGRSVGDLFSGHFNKAGNDFFHMKLPDPGGWAVKKAWHGLSGMNPFGDGPGNIWNDPGDTINAIRSLSGGVASNKGTQQGQTYRPGGNSYHARHQAVDFTGAKGPSVDSKELLAINHYFAQKYGTKLAELIYAGPGGINIKDGKVVNGMAFYGQGTMSQHHNHVHVAATPASLKGAGGGVNAGSTNGSTSSSNSPQSKGGMAGGSYSGGLSEMANIAAGLGAAGGLSSAGTGSKSSAGSSSSIPGTSAIPSGGLAGWEKTALGLLHLDYNKYSGGLTNLIMKESAGNPRAVNKSDSNAAAGHPSEGLMQMIQSTFNSNKFPGHNDIWNPIDNILSGVRYIEKNYGLGMLQAGGRKDSSGNYIGYALGSQDVPRDEWAKVHKGEMIFQRDTADAFREMARSSGFKGGAAGHSSGACIHFGSGAINISMPSTDTSTANRVAKQVADKICDDQRIKNIQMGLT